MYVYTGRQQKVYFVYPCQYTVKSKADFEMNKLNLIADPQRQCVVK